MLYNDVQNIEFNARDFDQIMFRHSCRCAFLVIGALMLLLALALALNIEFGAAQAQTHQVQRAHVAQAVSRLENGCLTCHDLVNARPPTDQVYTLVKLFDPAQNNRQTALQISEISSETATFSLNTQLIETGQRILDLPDAQIQGTEAVIEDYLHVYALTSTAPSEQITQWAIWQLDEIETLLRILENQASPYQLARQENRPTPSSSIALQTLTTAPNVALVMQSISMGDVVQVTVTRPETAPLAMPLEIVYATHHRGPPASVYLDSVL